MWPFKDVPTASPLDKPVCKYNVGEWVRYRVDGDTMDGKIKHVYVGRRGGLFTPTYEVLENGRYYTNRGVVETNIIGRIPDPLDLPNPFHAEILMTEKREIFVEVRFSHYKDKKEMKYYSEKFRTDGNKIADRQFISTTAAYDYLFANEEKILGIDPTLVLHTMAIAEKIRRATRDASVPKSGEM